MCPLNSYDVNGNAWAQAMVENYGNATIKNTDSNTDYKVYANLKKEFLTAKCMFMIEQVI